MMRDHASRLLWNALILEPPQAREAWRSWRATADIDRLDSGSFHLLPALAARLPEWLEDDPLKAILMGICRRAWSRNQLQRKLLADAVRILAAAGIARVAAVGPVAWGPLYWPEASIRVAGSVDLLAEPECAQRAFDALREAAWKAAGPLPVAAAKTFRFLPGMAFEAPSGGRVGLHWRVLPNSSLALRRPEFPDFRPAPPDFPTPYSVPPEYHLVAVLGLQHQDGTPWQFDAAAICRQTGLRWGQLRALVRWRPAERERLSELGAEWGVDIPPEVTRSVPTAGLERALAAALRTYRRTRRHLGQPTRV